MSILLVWRILSRVELNIANLKKQAHSGAIVNEKSGDKRAVIRESFLGDSPQRQ
jgi:hypothetical protein